MRYRSPAAAPFDPSPPWPESRIRDPSETPAGIFTRSVLSSMRRSRSAPRTASRRSTCSSASASRPRNGHGLSAPPSATPAAAEEVAEDRPVVEVAHVSDVDLREIAQVEGDFLAGAAAVLAPPANLVGGLLVEAGAERVRAELVVELALLLVGEHLVGGRDLLELVLGLPVPGVHVGVVLLRELPVGLPDLVVRGASIHAKDVVQVSLGHGEKLTRQRPRSTLVLARTGA